MVGHWVMRDTVSVRSRFAAGARVARAFLGMVCQDEKQETAEIQVEREEKKKNEEEKLLSTQ